MTSPEWYASAALLWPRQVKNLDVKLDVAQRVAMRANSDEVIGIGSGSAAYLTLWAIGKRVASEGLRVTVIPTSYETEVAATTLGLPLTRLGQTTPAWSVDGADEVDPAGRLLKGRGGALFREKLLWSTSQHMVLAIDSTKRVERLGTKFPVPVEVHPNAVEPVAARLQDFGCREPLLRVSSGKDGPVITESGFLLLDAYFPEIPVGLNAKIKQLSGVLETGLFEGYQYEIVD
ncbi:MAG TPA: ribose 5-phosphate isomerase A [Solirubrobacteraceae bacterium]|jgi:ribose 5-phosphate isomerase A